MTVDNSETQDIVETVATENTDADSQEIKEWGQDETQEPEQAQDENQEPEKQEPEPEKPKKSRAQERIEQLAREKAELAAKLAAYETKTQATEIKRPVIDDFEDFGEYEAALEKYHIDQAEARVLAKLDERESQKTKQQKLAEFEAAVAEIGDQGIDFQEYEAKAESLPQLPVILDQFGLSAKDTLLLAKKLIDDEATYIELSQMSAVQAAAKIGQIIALEQTPKTTPPVSKAPPPVKPVQANAPAVRDPSKMSDDEWYREQVKQRKGK
ncbi:MAG TPA: hypothetical protein GXX13_11405 [Acinetobacter towneri]|nr:hypothetical protein [Acinetobacter towneri]